MAKKSGAARKKTGKPTGKAIPIAQDKTYRVFVVMPAGKSATELGAFSLDLCCMPHRHDTATGTTRMMAYATGRHVEKLRSAGHQVEVLADADKEGKALQKLIGTGDRFEGGKRGPHGVGRLV